VKRKLPEDYRALASKTGRLWIGPEVKCVNTPTRWKCHREHEWTASYANTRRGYGCPYCYGNFQKTPDHYLALALRKGRTWTGPMVNSVLDKTGWRCSNGHDWMASYHGAEGGRGCPYCSNRVAKTPADFHSLAASKGWLWTGPEVRYTAEITGWKCDKSHGVLARYNDIDQGRGCPKCANHISKPEIRLRGAVAQVYPDTLGNVRSLLPNKRFELDIYVPSLKKAVEYDGWAHAYYLDAPARDQRKNAQCAEAGIELLRVTDEEYRKDPSATTAKVLAWLASK